MATYIVAVSVSVLMAFPEDRILAITALVKSSVRLQRFCHGLDGSSHDQFEADCLPCVPRLTAEAQELFDGELYFIIPAVSATPECRVSELATNPRRSGKQSYGF